MLALWGLLHFAMTAVAYSAVFTSGLRFNPIAPHTVHRLNHVAAVGTSLQ